MIWIWVRNVEGGGRRPHRREAVIDWLSHRDLAKRPFFKPTTTPITSAAHQSCLSTGLKPSWSPLVTWSVPAGHVRQGGDAAGSAEPVQVIDVKAHPGPALATGVLRPLIQRRHCSAGTLFAGGCGRLFEGSAADMHQALGRQQALAAQCTAPTNT